MIKSSRSENYILEVAKEISFSEKKFNLDMLLDEWKLLRIQSFVYDPNQKEDNFWNNIINLKSDDNKPKYLLVSTILKTSLFVSHSIAIVGLNILL